MTDCLLDSSILADLGDSRRERHPRLRRWFEDVPAGELFTCTIVVGELARGVATLPDGHERRQQEHHLHHVVIPSFRVLPLDTDAALHWGTAMGEGQRIGAIPPNEDVKIAAIAAARGDRQRAGLRAPGRAMARSGQKLICRREVDFGSWEQVR